MCFIHKLYFVDARRERERERKKLPHSFISRKWRSLLYTAQNTRGLKHLSHSLCSPKNEMKEGVQKRLLLCLSDVEERGEEAEVKNRTMLVKRIAHTKSELIPLLLAHIHTWTPSPNDQNHHRKKKKPRNSNKYSIRKDYLQSLSCNGWLDSGTCCDTYEFMHT